MKQDKQYLRINRRQFLKAGVGVSLGLIVSCSKTPLPPLITILHNPSRYARRYGDFTANICGRLDKRVEKARFRLNGGDWKEIKHAPPRISAPNFSIELPVNSLRPGKNHLVISATAKGETQLADLQFEYNPDTVKLPNIQSWNSTDLDVQDGAWETFLENGQYRVRPKPGFEDYDRLVVVNGAFPGGRRIETDIIFRHQTKSTRPFGFGVLPMWGGRPDYPGIYPRRGWNFSLAWYYSHYKGVGLEFSYKFADAAPDWTSTYRNLKLQSNIPYRIIVEAWPVHDEKGNHLRYVQRMKWMSGAQTDAEWMLLEDSEGSPLPEGEYGVALVAHRCQVDFGPVKVMPLPQTPET